MILAALQDRLPRSAWGALLVQPETVLGWHRELVRRRWAAYRARPRTGRPLLAEPVRELMVQMARANPRWGYFRIRGCTVIPTSRSSHTKPWQRLPKPLLSDKIHQFRGVTDLAWASDQWHPSSPTFRQESQAR